MHKKILLTICLLTSCCTFSQSLTKLQSQEKIYQDCLDSGIDMLGCSINNYNEIDKLLNEVYNKVKLKLSDEEKLKLRNEQRDWLKKRDKYFENLYIKTQEESEGIGGNDLKMIYNHEKAEYVKQRVLFLIKEYKVL
jgi:uncharacterized protein YecT (DUF1311 family)